MNAPPPQPERADLLARHLAQLFPTDSPIRTDARDETRPGDLRYYVRSSEFCDTYHAHLGFDADQKPLALHCRLSALRHTRDNNLTDRSLRHQLRAHSAIELAEGRLTLWFDLRPLAAGRGRLPTQRQLCQQIEQTVLAALPAPWRRLLTGNSGNADHPGLLAQHLQRFCTRNRRDDYIEKNLQQQLRQRLDSYLQENFYTLQADTPIDAEALQQRIQHAAQLREAAQAQIAEASAAEQLREALFVKRKFVLQTRWHLSQDIAPAPDDAPALATIDNAQALAQLANLDNLQHQTLGTLLRAENFQALRLLEPTLAGSIDCTYIDPPYNTTEDTFTYKNRFARAAWLTMLDNRIELAQPLLKPSGVLQVAIDDAEVASLRALLDARCGGDNRLATLVAEVNPAGQNLKPNAPAVSHDYCHVYARDAGRARLRLRPLSAAEQELYKQQDPQGPFLWDNLRRRGGNSRPGDRPNQWYPLYVDVESGRVSLAAFVGAQEVWPIDPKGEKRIWRVTRSSAERDIAAGEISVLSKAGRIEVVKKSRMPTGRKPKTLWCDAKHSATSHGTKLLNDIIGEQRFSYPKSLYLVKDCLNHWCPKDGTVLDFFAGSGTTGHAVFDLNRDDGGTRKFVLAEMGDHFDSVLVPRIRKLMQASRWRGGEARSCDPLSGVVKELAIESYDDCQANFGALPDAPPTQLRYLRDACSGTLTLNVTRFDNPWRYTLKTRGGGGLRDAPVDLVETFNLLLGLRVERYVTCAEPGLLCLTGALADGCRALVVWRDCERWPAERLQAQLEAMFGSAPPQHFERLYINGDNLPDVMGSALPPVRPIEAAFVTQMFDRPCPGGASPA